MRDLLKALGSLCAGFLLFVGPPALSDEQNSASSEVAAATAPAVDRTLKVLPATDTSGFNIAGPLQNALGVLLTELGWFNVTLTSYSLSGFTEAEVTKTHETLNAEVLSFVYLEKERLAVFLFDIAHRGNFIVDSQPLTLPAGTSLTSAWIESRLRLAVRHVALAYRRGQYQPLPGFSANDEKLAKEQNEDARSQAEVANHLFHELAASEDSPYFVGATVGMSRSGVPGANASNLDFGAFTGLNFSDLYRAQLGIDVFDQLGANLGLAYRLPWAQQYISIWGGLGVEHILSPVAVNNVVSGATLPSGQTMFGPELEFRIPMLGVELRANLRYYMGGGSLFIGTYGVSCSL